MLSVFKLVLAHPKFAIVNSAYLYIAATQLKFAFFEAHGRRTIAASTALVKHQIAETAF
jgi:hypothetical protein